jgi:hypothetical protein
MSLMRSIRERTDSGVSVIVVGVNGLLNSENLPSKGALVWLGTYNSPEEAGRAYDVEARRVRGKMAKLSFPDEVLAWLIRSALLSLPL